MRHERPIADREPVCVCGCDRPLTAQTRSRIPRLAFLGSGALLVAAIVSAPLSAIDGTATHSNQLAGETSPYLQQHANDAVAWHPWGSAAFERARKEQKPVFLSVGYSTCHWCHVMRRESFIDPAIAARLNADFVCIKVDREERPDIDRVYMSYVIATTGRGGWPMSVWLTPEGNPFFGGMYFPPERQGSTPAFGEVLADVKNRWDTRRAEVLSESVRALNIIDARPESGTPTRSGAANTLQTDTLRAAWRAFDDRHGGFGAAPKFPQTVLLEFLLDACAMATDGTQRKRAEQMAVTTLEAIVAGGIHDQLGGGFHRYSVDARWRVPHFEKMLSDQAQLANACLTAWQISGKTALRQAAMDTLDYVHACLTDPEGGFYSAEDAESSAGAGAGLPGEGSYYLWTAEEIASLLPPDDARLFAFVFGVSRDGNASKVSTALAGKNVLYRAQSIEAAARRFGLSNDAASEMLRGASTKLRVARSLRTRPQRDTKIIAGWNGLAISAFARAAQILEAPRYADVATRAAHAVRGRLFDAATGRLFRSWREGVRGDVGFAEDYAGMIRGLIDLYEATADQQWLTWAAALQEKQIGLFWDPVDGAFFASTGEDANLLVRLKDNNEGAEPTASSISVRNLLRLSEFFDREPWRLRAKQTALGFQQQLKRDPLSMPGMVAAIGMLEGSMQLVVVHGERSKPDTTRLLREVNTPFLPRRVLVRVDVESRPHFDANVEFVRQLPPDPLSGATAYLCENHTCQLPTSDPTVLRQQLLSGQRRSEPRRE